VKVGAWHYGYTLNPRSTPDPARGAGRPGDGRSAVPTFVPPAYEAPIARAASRWNVSASLLAAQIYVESGFNPSAISPAGARGIAQLMPGTARSYGLRDPFDAAAAIQAQGRLMRDLLRRFGTVPLALAAYNAGPGAVAGCGCIPPYPETRAYVARVLALMGSAGEIVPGDDGPKVRLVE
jgi:soluble lytic murein transglycosylase-like protein